jgi:hypothetical protein
LPVNAQNGVGARARARRFRAPRGAAAPTAAQPLIGGALLPAHKSTPPMMIRLSGFDWRLSWCCSAKKYLRRQ